MIKTNGYFRLHRSIFLNPVVTKDPDYFLVWVYLLSQAEYEKGRKVDFGKEVITLKPGQFTIGISNQMLADLQRVKRDFSKSKLFRILKRYESEMQIEKRTDGQTSLITVLNWSQYQKSDTECETNSTQNRKTSEKRVKPKERNTRNKNKEIKEGASSLPEEAPAPEEEEEEITDEMFEAMEDI